MQNRPLFALVATLLFLVSGASRAYSYEESSLEDKAKASDLVIIGEVSSVFADGCKPRYTCARIEVVDVVKGAPKGETIVLFEGPIAEHNPRCCEVGVRYLFFLERLDGNFFSSADGPYGVYRTSP